MAAPASHKVKCMVIGDDGVGKSTMIHAYASGAFPNKPITVFDIGAITKTAGSATFALSLFDTAGSPENDRLRPLSYPGTDVVLLVYSVVSRASFASIRDKWCSEVKAHLPTVPIVLVGHKTDLLPADDSVTTDEGAAMAKEVGAVKFIECSSKTPQELANVFEQAMLATLHSEGKKGKCSIQ